MAKRNTWQREAVREALDSRAGFVSAQALHSSLHEAGTSIGLATVYRAPADLAERGAADSRQGPDGENLFRACVSTDHHHHLICKSCGMAVEIEAREVEQWAQATAAQYGFTQAQHVVDIFGRCPACSRARDGQ